MATTTYYTIEQVNEFIPTLERSFRRIIQLRMYLQTLYQRLSQSGLAPAGDEFDIAPDDASPEALDDLSSLKTVLDAMKEEINNILDCGCELKDIEQGIVDWYAQKEGKEIFLCWKLGEKEVNHWHNVDEGFDGRKPL